MKLLTPTLAVLGSSPHTRDKLFRNEFGDTYDRIIPAYAGQTQTRRLTKAWIEDHPRIRGTNVFNGLLSFCKAGSSPHTRDKHVTPGQGINWIGIIPAYAGQTLETPLSPRIRQDHPRIRGTNDNDKIIPLRKMGSSPHTRDKLTFGYRTLHKEGIIPAYAGQTNDVFSKNLRY